MAPNVRDLQPGTHVYSSDGEHVGDVAEVGTTYLRVRKGWFFVKERYVPFDAVGRIEVDGVYLTVAMAQLDAMAWDDPPAETASARTAPASTVAVDVTDTMVEQRTPGTTLDQAGAATTLAVDDAPVNAQDRPRDGVVYSERRTADAVDSGTEVAAFQEGTFEVRARHEELIVGKRARVVEEIVLNTNVTERTETVQDTVRRTRVDVDEVSGQTTSAQATTRVETSSTAADEGALEGGASKARKHGGGRGRRRLP